MLYSNSTLLLKIQMDEKSEIKSKSPMGYSIEHVLLWNSSESELYLNSTKLIVLIQSEVFILRLHTRQLKTMILVL